MVALLEIESTLTERYQTTVPEPVRRALKLGKCDKIRYSILPDGAVVMTRASPPVGDDPVLGQFLDFLARDLVAPPARIQVLDTALADRLATSVGNVEVDLDAPLAAEDE